MAHINFNTSCLILLTTVLSRILSFSCIAACEFLFGTKKQAEEMGSRWIDEIKEEFTFAILCRGDTKVISYLTQGQG